MPTAGIPLNPECVRAFEDIQQRKTNKYCTFKIEERNGHNEVVVDYKAEASTTETLEQEKACWDEFKERLVELNKPRYCIYDFNHTSPSGQKIKKVTYIYWSPDSAASKDKMIYASTNDSCKKAFQGLSKYHQCNDSDELSFQEIYENTVKSI